MRGPGGTDPRAARHAESARLPVKLDPNSPDGQGTPQQTPQARALGSGFVWDTHGHIVTNNHVVDGARKSPSLSPTV